VSNKHIKTEPSQGFITLSDTKDPLLGIFLE